MRDLFLRFLLVFSILAAISPCNRLHSCYDGPEWEGTRIVFFNPELGNDSTGLQPFFYSYRQLFQSDYDGFTRAGADNTINDYQRNCREWQAFIGKQVDLQDIYKVIYGGSADSFSTALVTQSLADFLPGNTFLKALQKPSNAAALQYLNFAKRVEFQQFESENDPWSEPQDYYQQRFGSPDTLLLDQLVQESGEQLAKTKDAFLRQRWAYQRINVLYYQAPQGAADSIRQIFDQYFDLERDQTMLLPWALLKVAETTTDPGKANYLYSQVFDRCQSKRIRATQLFQSKLAEKAFPFAKNGREKAAILAMRAMQNPGRGLNDLQNMALLSVESPYLPLLLTREINKAEDWLLTYPLTGLDPWHSFLPEYSWDENYDRKIDRWNRINAVKDRQYVTALRAFVERVEKKQRSNSKISPFLQLALAHLYYMEQRPADAWRTLQSMPPTDNKRWELQKKIEEILLLPSQADVLQATTQTALYERLHYVRKNAALLTEPSEQLSRIYLALSHAFWIKKDIPTAGLLFGRAVEQTGTRRDNWWTTFNTLDFYDNQASIADLESLERLLKKKEKTPFENYITQPFQKFELPENLLEWRAEQKESLNAPIPSDNQLQEMIGTFALRDNDLNRAVAAFARVDTAYWGDYTVDLCGSTKLIATDSLPPLPGNTKYQIVKKMLALEKEAAANPAKRAENYYLLGNAWFHISYWGYASGMFVRSSSTYDTDAPDKYPRGPNYLTNRPALRYGNVFYRCARSVDYFQKSLENKPDSELAARAFYMLAECDRRDRWMSIRRDPKSKLEEGGVTSPLFKTWGNRYGKTAAYKECLEACPDLRTYFGK